MSEIAVLDIKGKKAGSLACPENLTSGEINQDVIHQAVVMYRACLRQGTAKTKERAEVSGGGRKPYKQKGTGRARHGSTRSPIFVGGGTTFGPRPRDYSYRIPKKVIKASLVESLKDRIAQGSVYCVNEISGVSKTKEFVSILESLKISGKTLVLLDGCEAGVYLSARNIPFLDIRRAQDINAYDILKHKNILATEAALKALLERV